ncbi:P-loop containing nucleoside triphosphate hydrolase protein [Auriscalpium vulgare]|uniref:P-loop containing nucleoside triphosphate hydrolase protein n=1 Tax=Auriscalpium vulgare TaxID=40419 RepID=A0ACB8S2J7_9AGAM|nr:P-loop containing nucleoside triphosphate hydrolase protein [Auriscalpium vulgare]
MTSSETDLLAFKNRHRDLLAKERNAEIERSTLLLSNCGPKLLEQKGLALNGLGIVGVNIGLGGKTLIELERPAAYHTSPSFPPHTIRPGDLARIEENVSGNGPPRKSVKSKKSVAGSDIQSRSAEGVVYKVTETRIVVAVDPSESSSDDLDLPERCRVVKVANSVTYDRMAKTLDQLERLLVPTSATSATGNASKDDFSRLAEVLLGITKRSPKLTLKAINFFDETLNDSQKEAIQFALESPEVACIHGPPGTGKTHTLVEIIRQLTSATLANPKPLRLLVCGASNLSVDNILERLLALPAPDKGEKLKVTRIGHPARVMNSEGVLESTLDAKAGRSDQAALAKDVKDELQAALDTLSGKGKSAKGKAPRGLERKKLWEEVRALRKEYRQREGGVVRSVLSESQVVLATCHSAGGRQLRNEKFDVVIIDEATQALEAVCWIPILKANKLILAGDPKQLPPTILSLDKSRQKKGLEKAKGAKATIPTPKSPSSSKKAPDSEPPDSSDSEDGDEELEDVPLPPEPTAGGPAASKNNRDPKVGAPKRPRELQGLKPPSTLETTMFERLEKMYGPQIKRMLTVQYRMHKQIAEFPSKVMYASRLTAHSSVASHLLRDLPNSSAVSEEDEKEILGTPVVFFDTAGCEYYERLDGDGDEGSRCNENEATVVKNWVEQLTSAGVSASQIAVITPYQAQVTLLTSLLRPLFGADIEVGTVDGMQGREKEAVIISLVRSNDKREVGFLKEKRRLNVAMTRARRHLCVVGDSSTVTHGGSYLKKWLAWLDAHADVRYAGLE